MRAQPPPSFTRQLGRLERSGKGHAHQHDSERAGRAQHAEHAVRAVRRALLALDRTRLPASFPERALCRYVSRNSLTGGLPTEIGDLTHLTSLCVARRAARRARAPPLAH